ncbi:MAG: hypothetical protein DIU52_010210 [bacterium]|jgi:hypothetical protein
MRAGTTILTGAFMALLAAPVAAAQGSNGSGPSAPADTASAKAAGAVLAPPIAIQHIRPADQRGINVFEPPKDDATPYAGFRIDFGGAFTTQFQSMSHSNRAVPNVVDSVNVNELIDIGWGVNLPTANLVMNAQLAPGIRVALETYLSSRHHQEAWVKGGYLQVDASPIDHWALNKLFEVLTVKVGMFDLNYGDAHFRRSDNGNALYNPFVGNLILDAFTFEPGAEIYLRYKGFLAMGGITTGVNKGDVTYPDARSPGFLAKLGFDRQINDALRVRLTGSLYDIDKSPSATLFWGDRAGSRYYMVMENVQANVTSQAWSGLINPAFRNEIRAIQINPFVKYGGLELFGVIERADGRASTEPETRRFEQYAADVVYRFLPGEKVYVGARYNTVEGELPISGQNYDISVDRWQFGAGWFVTPTILLKGEYARQRYLDFPETDIRHGGKFSGFIFEGVVSF